MKNIIRNLMLATLSIFIITGEGYCQPGRRAFVSTEIRKDRTVTFQFRAPDAKEVKLSTQFVSGLQDMKKDENGIWSITLGPADPDIYPYCFVVDGIRVADPGNSWIFPNEGFQNSV